MRESVIYQGIIREGLQQGIQQGKRELTMRLLTRRIGEVAPDLQAQIKELSTPQLEELGEALLDFNNATDLAAWLESR